MTDVRGIILVRDKEKEIQAYLENMYKRMSWGYDWKAIDQYRYKHYIRLMERYLKRKKRRILEIGCASGTFTEKLYYINTNNEIVSVDVACGAIEKAKERELPVDFRKDSLPKLHVKGKFDLVLTFEVLSYIKEKTEEALDTIQKRMKQNGFWIMSVVVNEGESYFDEKEIVRQVTEKFEIIYKEDLHFNLYRKLVGKCWNKSFWTEWDSKIEKNIVRAVMKNRLLPVLCQYIAQLVAPEKYKSHIILVCKKK